MKKTGKFREPTQEERNIFQLLLRESFPGKESLSQQLARCQVRTIDGEGSLEIKQLDAPAAQVVRRIPVEAYANDEDGVTIHALLHVVNGKATELEFYKDDSSKIRKLPDKWEIMIL